MSGRSICGCSLKYQYGHLSAGPLSCKRGRRESFSFWLIHIRKQSAKRWSNIFHVCDLINKQGQKSTQHHISHTRHSFPFEKPALMSVLSHLPIHNSSSYVRDCNLFPEEPRLAFPAPQSCDQVQNEEMKEGFELLQAASWIMIENKGLNDTSACRSSRTMCLWNNDTLDIHLFITISHNAAIWKNIFCDMKLITR